MDAVEIIVEVRFAVDLDGNSRIIDRKVVKNLTDQEQQLDGPFHQTIHSEIDNIVGEDSEGNKLTCLRRTDSNTNELELNFAPPSGRFVIPAKATNWFEIRYDAFAFARRVSNGLLFRVRSGNVKYQTSKFSQFSFRHTYEFDLRRGKNWIHRLFNTYEVHLLGFNGTTRKENGKIVVQTSGSLVKQGSQTNFVWLEPRYRKGLALVLSAAGGAGLRTLVQWILELFKNP